MTRVYVSEHDLRVAARHYRQAAAALDRGRHELPADPSDLPADLRSQAEETVRRARSAIGGQHHDALRERHHLLERARLAALADSEAGAEVFGPLAALLPGMGPGTGSKGRATFARAGRAARGGSGVVAQAARRSTVDRRIAYAVDYLRRKGLTAAQAAGLVGNLQLESGGRLDPAQRQVGGGPGRGIGQWTYGESRYRDLVRFARARGHSWSDYHTQVQFVWFELRNRPPYTQALRALRDTSSVRGATTVVMKRYERPSIPNLDERLRYAHDIHRRFT